MEILLNIFGAWMMRAVKEENNDIGFKIVGICDKLGYKYIQIKNSEMKNPLKLSKDPRIKDWIQKIKENRDDKKENISIEKNKNKVIKEIKDNNVLKHNINIPIKNKSPVSNQTVNNNDNQKSPIINTNPKISNKNPIINTNSKTSNKSPLLKPMNSPSSINSPISPVKRNIDTFGDIFKSKKYKLVQPEIDNNNSKKEIV